MAWYSNILKTITGAAGQAAQKVASYVAPKKSAPKAQSSSYSAPKVNAFTQPQNTYSSKPSGGYSTPSGTVYSSSAPRITAPTQSSFSTPKSSTFKLPSFSLVKPAYAAEPGATYSVQPKTNSFSNLLGSIGSVIKQSPYTALASALGTHIGSWGTPELGITEKFQQKIAPGSQMSEEGGSKLGRLALGMRLDNTAGVIPNVNIGKTFQDNYAARNKMMMEAGQRQEEVKGAYDDANAGLKTQDVQNQQTQQQMDGAWAVYNAETEALINDINNGIYQSQEEVDRKQAEIDQKYQESIYNTLIGQYEASKKPYEEQFASDKAYLEGQIGSTTATAEGQKAKVANDYGGLIRGIVQKGQVGQNDLRNIYSALGTAESSSAMDQFRRLESQKGQDIAETERSQQDKLFTIDQAIMKFKTDTQKAIQDELIKKNAAIQQIDNNIQMKQADKAAALAQINQTLSENIAKLQQASLETKANLLAQRQAAAQAMNEIQAQGIIDTNIANITNQPYGITTPDASELPGNKFTGNTTKRTTPTAWERFLNYQDLLKNIKY